LSSAVKAITAAQLSMASGGVYSVTLDEAIAAMKRECPVATDLTEASIIWIAVTAQDMSVKYKETSLSVRCLIFFTLPYSVLIAMLVFVSFRASRCV
jgi:L-serine deaminase